MEALIFDTETSGLISSALVPLDKQPEIVEIYAALVDLDTGEIKYEFESLFKPKGKFQEKAKKVTGMNEEFLKDAPTFYIAAKQIHKIMEHAPLVIAHNAAFDVEMVDIEMKRLGMVIKWPRVLCTVEQTVHLKGYRLGLNVLYEELFGEKFKDAHRAKPDTQALIRVCCELHKRGVI